MNYEEFRTIWHNTLKSSGLTGLAPIWPSEKIETRTMDRTYSLPIVWKSIDHQDNHFNVTAKLSWRWDALQSARFSTTEEDMLSQIYDDFTIHEDTDPPWMRLDVCLKAHLQHSHQSKPLPFESTWDRWINIIQTKVTPILWFYDGNNIETGKNISWCGEPEATVHYDQDTGYCLSSVTLSAFKGIYLPRNWDHPGKKDMPTTPQLTVFFSQVKNALSEWDASLQFLKDD